MWEILPCCTYVLLPSKFSFAQNDFIAFNFWQSRKSKANYTLTACKFDDAVWMPCIKVECRLRQHQHQHQKNNKYTYTTNRIGKVSIKSKHHSSIWLFANVYGLNWENVRKRKQIIWHNMLWYGSCTCSLHSRTYVWCRPKHSVFHVSAATCTELCFWDESKSNEKKRQQVRQIRRTNEKIENPAKHRYQHLTDYIFLVSLSLFFSPSLYIYLPYNFYDGSQHKKTVQHKMGM